jgi:predicted N-acetyltransferase YhbS
MGCITENYINDNDLMIVAEDEEKIIGCLFVGAMAGGDLVYLDKFHIVPAYAKQGVGGLMSIWAIKESNRRGFKHAFGIIQHDDYHDASAINALKAALGSDGKLYTYVIGNVPFMASEIGE